jgi:hypothetical protein
VPQDVSRRWAEGSDVEAVERALEDILAMLERIVSGGQTGADQAVARRGGDCRAQDPRAERRRQP